MMTQVLHVSALWFLALVVAMAALEGCALLRRLVAAVENMDDRHAEQVALLRLDVDLPYSRPQVSGVADPEAEGDDPALCPCPDCVEERARFRH